MTTSTFGEEMFAKKFLSLVIDKKMWVKREENLFPVINLQLLSACALEFSHYVNWYKCYYTKGWSLSSFRKRLVLFSTHICDHLRDMWNVHTRPTIPTASLCTPAFLTIQSEANMQFLVTWTLTHQTVWYTPSWKINIPIPIFLFNIKNSNNNTTLHY